MLFRSESRPRRPSEGAIRRSDLRRRFPHTHARAHARARAFGCMRVCACVCVCVCVHVRARACVSRSPTAWLARVCECVCVCVRDQARRAASRACLSSGVSISARTALGYLCSVSLRRGVHRLATAIRPWGRRAAGCRGRGTAWQGPGEEVGRIAARLEGCANVVRVQPWREDAEIGRAHV